MQPGNKIDFSSLHAAMLPRAKELLVAWLPGGKFVGKEYICGNLRGEPGTSLSVNTLTGMWSDFATGQKGGDLISLYAAIHGVNNGKAARDCSKIVGFQLNLPVPVGRDSRPKPMEVLPTLPPEGKPGPSMYHVRFGAPSMSWCYRNALGSVMFYVARYESEAGKQILPWSWVEGRWVCKGWPAPRPIYGLEILAKFPSRPFMLVEGEKACEAARLMAGDKYTVLTWPNGAKAVDKVDWQPLYGKKGIIWPDADDAGSGACELIGSILVPHCPDLKKLDVSDDGAPEGWDAADALDAGWNWDKLLEWAKPRARSFTPASTTIVNNDNRSVTVVNPSPDDMAEPPPSMIVLWEQLGLQMTQAGTAVTNLVNVGICIRAFPPLRGRFWFDEFQHRIFTSWAGPIREWSDHDDYLLTEYLQSTLGLQKIGDDIVHKAVVVEARRNVRNAPRDWMETLAWDGVDRCETMIPRVFGCEDNEYTRAISLNFWVGMIARVYRPGCQLDNMIVLEGGQGVGKTTACRIIGGDWFAAAHESVTSKDFFMALHGVLIMEIAELDAFSKAETTRVKSVVTTCTDRYRSPYARNSESHARRSIFIATSNTDDWNKDDTGARRFWPVRCGKIDNSHLKRERDQLFAEAVARFKRGDSWHIVPSDQTLVEQEMRRQADEWESAIAEYLKVCEVRGHDAITVRDIAEECLRIPIDRLEKHIQMRIARILRRLGYQKRHATFNGNQGKHWFKEAGAPADGAPAESASPA